MNGQAFYIDFDELSDDGSHRSFAPILTRSFLSVEPLHPSNNAKLAAY
jgi:hypothetical protein